MLTLLDRMASQGLPGVLVPVHADNVPSREWRGRQLLAGVGAGLVLAAGTKWYRP